ncbi:MAG: HAD-IA family hydrolase [Bacilli bacterium]|nr:HAD-IA family hydrolase [Bacilli bacterium]
MYNALIFDLDGTIIDTLPDITRAINQAMEDASFPYRYSVEEAMNLIGGGALAFIKKALQEEGNDEEKIDRLRPFYLKYYEEFQCDTSKPYDGVVEFLKDAKRKGVKLYVITTKPNRLAQEIVRAKIGDNIIDEIRGQIDGIPHKPDPSVSNKLIEKEKLDKNSILWIGDSMVDLKTAQNVGVDCALVSYGYGHLKGNEPAKYHINSINELVSLL